VSTLFLILYAVALAIAVLNAMGRKEAPLWLAVAILAAIPLLTRFIV
jgi:hypothetical protein